MKNIYLSVVFKAIIIAAFILFFETKILADYTVASGQNINASTLTGQSGVLIINGTLTLSSNVTLSGFTGVIINCPGKIFWSNNSDLTFAAGTSFDVIGWTTGSTCGIQPTGGNASKRLIIGSTIIAVSNDNSNNAAYSFNDFNSAGGLADFTLSNYSPICYASSFAITLTPTDNIVGFDCTWSIDQGTFSNNSTTLTASGFTGSTTATIIPTNSTSSKTYTITCTTKRHNDGDALTVKTTTVTVSPTTIAGTLPTITSCSTGSGSLTLSGNVGSVLQWESSTDGSTWTPISNTTTSQTYTAAAQTVYYRTLVQSGVCSSSYTAIDTIGIHNYWVGTTSTDWSAAGNWSDKHIPSFGACSTVAIPTGTTYSPKLSTDVTVTDLSVNSGANLDLNGHTLTLNGAFTGSSTGNLKGSATSGLVIGGSAGSLYFDQVNNILKTLTVNSSSSATLGNALNITSGSGFGTVTVNGTLNANGNLTLKSDANGTAAVGSSAGTISGNVTLERYIPARRAWRFFCVPFKSSTQTIRDAWQEGANNASIGANYDPNPGYGTHITGNNNTSLGYDYNISTNPSLKVWQNNAWSASEPVTVSDLITKYSAYCLFVRGSRGINLSLGTGATADNTVLRMTGVLNETGVSSNAVTQSFSGTAGHLLFVGNPYASSIDLLSMFNHSSGIADKQFWVWDPKLSGSYSNYNVGGYVTYNNGIMVPNVGSYTSPTTIIQSGQAFMVKLTAGTASVQFRQNDKSSSTQSSVFGRQAQAPIRPAIYVNLMTSAPGNMVTVDGVATGFGRKYSPDVDSNDASKLWNFDENMAIIRNGSALAIEFRPVPVVTDTLFFKLYLRQQPYTFRIFSQNLPAHISIQAWIVDKYLNTQTEIDLSDTTLYNFTPNSDTNSYRNRFMLVYSHTTKMVRTKIAAKQQSSDMTADKAADKNVAGIYPNPVTGSSFNLVMHNLEKGNYIVKLFSVNGVQLLTQTINHEEGTNEYNIKLPAHVTAGNYTVQVLSSSGKVVCIIPLIVSK